MKLQTRHRFKHNNVRSNDSIPTVSDMMLLFRVTIDVVNRVRNGESIPFRPQLPESSELGKKLIDSIRNGWNENPEQRPTFQQIRGTLRKLTNGESVFSSLVSFLLISVFFRDSER